MANFSQLLQWIQTYPGLFAAMCGLMLASSYLLLMLATRLGDIKPGVQTFILSGVIHLVMAMFWGTLAVPIGNPGGRGTRLEITPIREVIVEDSTKETGQPGENDVEGEAVWDALPTSRIDPFARAGTQSDAVAPTETPDRTAEIIEPSKGSLPDLPRPEEVAVAEPRPADAAITAPRKAVDQTVDIGEETAQAKSDEAVGNGTLARGMIAGAVIPDEPVRREPVKGATVGTNITALPTPPSGLTEELTGEDGPERLQAEPQVTQRRTAPAKADIDLEELGIGAPSGAESGGTGGKPDGKVGGTGTATEGASKFARAGIATGSSEVASTRVERARTTKIDDSGLGRGAGMASLSSGATGARLGSATDERPSLERPNFGAIAQPGAANVPDTYRLRGLAQRKRMAVRLGATQESERAVEQSLRWLALHQSLEGYWDADGFDAHCPGRDKCWGKGGRGSPTEAEKISSPTDRLALQSAGQQADAGLTALVLLTFLGAGYTHEDGLYADQVDRAVRWLIRQQQSNGFLGGKASHYERMYCHGMATYALGEAYGMMDNPDSDPQLRDAVARAVQYIVAMQNPNDGGWRYLDGNLPKQEGDMSMFGWQLMALKSSQIAGVTIPDKTQAGLVKFLKRISLGERRGLASYRFGEAPKASMTAEALFCRQMLGMKRDNPSSLEAVEFLTKHPPRQTEQDLYYWYYGTLAMYQYGGEPWRVWNDQLRDTLVATQRQTGHAAGSWDPRDNWSLHGGRLYSTALSTLCLEVYYRFLPLYQLNDSRMESMTD